MVWLFSCPRAGLGWDSCGNLWRILFSMDVQDGQFLLDLNQVLFFLRDRDGKVGMLG